MAWGGLHFFLHANKKSAREGPGRALSGGEALTYDRLRTTAERPVTQSALTSVLVRVAHRA